MVEVLLMIGQLAVFLLGCRAIHQAGNFIIFFRASKRSLSFAMQKFLFEQIISAVGTMFFSVNSLIGTIRGEHPSEWNNMNPELPILIRAIMFGFMIHATTSMSYEVKKIIEGQCDD